MLVRRRSAPCVRLAVGPGALLHSATELRAIFISGGRPASLAPLLTSGSFSSRANMVFSDPEVEACSAEEHCVHMQAQGRVRGELPNHHRASEKYWPTLML